MRMTVYKGTGEQSSSQSPALNFDRSAVTLRLTWVILTKLTGCTVELQQKKTSDIRDGDIFDHLWHNLSKLGRGSQEDATNIISRRYA